MHTLTNTHNTPTTASNSPILTKDIINSKEIDIVIMVEMKKSKTSLQVLTQHTAS